MARSCSPSVFRPAGIRADASVAAVWRRIGRSYPTTTLLMDGTILVAGGHQPGKESDGPAYSSAELYGPPMG
jgi:hypothetical protein